MNCNDVNKELDKGNLAWLPPEVEIHLQTCERCRELVTVFCEPAVFSSPAPETIVQIEKAIAADLRPVRPLAPNRSLFLLVVVLVACVVALGVGRLGVFGLPLTNPLQGALVLSTLAISVGLVAYSLVNQMVPGSLHRLSPRLLPLGVIVLLALATAILFPFQHERDFWPKALWCIRAGTSIGAWAVVPLWLVLRRGAILSGALTGATAGLLAGLVGATVLEIHCPNLDAWHVLLSHLGVAVFGATAGLLLGLATEICTTLWRRPERT
jgi:hypothetical protein